MAIGSSDIVLRLSVKTGSAGDTTSSTAADSLGKYVSTTVLTTSANGLFDDISGTENAASTVDYRCIFVLNNHATLALQNAVAYISAETAGGASVALASDNIAASAKGGSSAQAAEITNETTAPSGISGWNTGTDRAGGLSLGTINAGYVKGLWIKRTAANNAAIDNDGFTIGIVGDTAA